MQASKVEMTVYSSEKIKLNTCYLIARGALWFYWDRSFVTTRKRFEVDNIYSTVILSNIGYFHSWFL